MKRRLPTPAVAVTAIVAFVGDSGVEMEANFYPSFMVTPEQAHRLAEAPVVTVRANRWAPDWQPFTEWKPGAMRRETAWSICVIAFISEEAEVAFDDAVDRLQEDIAAGRIERGTHGDPEARLPGDPFEAELEAFRRQVLAELDVTLALGAES